nr:TetR/AcrR family transcriptional regulator [Mammaliicoccus sp. Marseille-Q6498]
MNDTSERLIIVSMQAFSEKGYYGTSLNNIAESLNIKKASLYNYIKSKDELYAQCITQCINQGIEIIERIDPNSPDIREELITFFKNYLFESDIFVKFYVQLSFAPENFTLEIEQQNDKLVNVFLNKLNQIHETLQLEINSEDFVLLVRMFLNGWIYRRAFIQSKSTQETVKNEFKQQATMLLNQVMEL